MTSFEAHLAEARRCLERGQGPAAWSVLRDGLRRCGPLSYEYETTARLLAAWPEGGEEVGAPRLSVAVMGGYTTEPLVHALRCAACRENLWLDVYEAPFQAYRQEILNAESGLYGARRDLVLWALHAHNLQPWPQEEAAATEVEEVLSNLVESFAGSWKMIQDRLGCPLWQHTIEPLGRRFIGPAEADWPASADAFTARLNDRLRRDAPPWVRWVDTAGLAVKIGLDQWFDRRMYFVGKYGFHPRFVDQYAGLLLGLLRAWRGTTRKALVLDLDNTLWGGVIGDDGLDGIQLGPVSPEGEAYAEFGRYLRQLSKRGVILAVCSKNDPAVAREVFLRHPAMALKLDDFAAFRCGWEDKATGLQALAQELNIGLEHLAFADDNPAECELVRQQLPAVEVLELKGDPAGFVAAIERQHWFDATRLSEEDRRRGDSYQARRQAEALRMRTPDLAGYLRSLDMKADVHPATPEEIARLAQMEQKTNQFNLATRRHDEAAIRDFMQREDAVVLACRLKDQFADHGLVASAILLFAGREARIASWLMSCRVFSRTLEQFMLTHIASLARPRGCFRLVAEYSPTPRNGLLKDILLQLGFRQTVAEQGREDWSLDLSKFDMPATFIEPAGKTAEVRPQGDNHQHESAGSARPSTASISKSSAVFDAGTL